MGYWTVAKCSGHGSLVKSHRTSVDRELMKQGIDCYMPMVRESAVRRHRKVEVIRPLFGGYIFVYAEDWCARRIMSTRGIKNILKMAGDWVRVRQDVIDSIKRREVGGIVQLPKRNVGNCFIPGQEVRINEGPFIGLNGLYEGLESEGRVSILLSLFGRESRVYCDENEIERC